MNRFHSFGSILHNFNRAITFLFRRYDDVCWYREITHSLSRYVQDKYAYFCFSILSSKNCSSFVFYTVLYIGFKFRTQYFIYFPLYDASPKHLSSFEFLLKYHQSNLINMLLKSIYHGSEDYRKSFCVGCGQSDLNFLFFVTVH